MTDVQNVLMELMDDIEMICRKRKLSYVLFGRTAILAKNSEHFIDDQFDFDIIMPLAHAMELKKYTEDHLKETRAVESYHDNPCLKQMIFRFVDRNTTLWDNTSGHYYVKPGIAVTIFVTRTQTFSGRVYGAERYVVAKNNNGGKLPYSVFRLKKMEKAVNEDPERAAVLFNEPKIEEIVHNTGALRWGYLRSLFMSDHAILLWTIKKNLAGGKSDGSANYFMTRTGGFHQFPDDLFEDPETLSFEGRALRNSKRYEEFMEMLYGEDWKSYGIMNYADGDRFRVIKDCHLPYEDFMACCAGRGRDMKEIMAEMTRFGQWKMRYFYPLEERVDHTFARVRRSVDRIDIWYKLRGKRKDLKKAAEEKNIKKLKDLLKEYLKKTEDYYGQGIGFMIDRDLFSYASMIWESEGRKDFADRVYELVPDLYKKESVEDYLKAREML